MAKDYADVKLRSELPRVAYTINPDGKLIPLVFGRGFGGVLEAKVEPIFNMVGGDTVLTMRVLLSHGEPVPWDMLRRITDAEFAEGRWLDMAEGRSELPRGEVLD